MEAYATYTVKLTETFENVAWHIRNKIISITINPNQIKLLEVPVEFVNEVAGMVYLKDEQAQKPLSRDHHKFFRDRSHCCGRNNN